MIIHVVEEGETIDSIARLYGIPVERLVLANGIRTSDALVVGETLVILIPEILYTVQDGDTLESIAAAHNVSIFEILRNNPYLSVRRFIYPGEVIVIKYEGEKIGNIAINGYAYPFIGINVLRQTLPFLTYLSVYAYYYNMNMQGAIININDDELIRAAREYGVAPIMILTAQSESPMDEIELTHNLLRNPSAQEQLIRNLINILNLKGYYGVDFTARYIEPEDRALYVEFIRKLSSRLRAEGFRTFITLSFNVFELLTNVFYEDLQLELLKDYVDNIIILTYDLGITNIAPSVLAYDTVNNLLEKIISAIPSEKIIFGISTIGYI